MWRLVLLAVALEFLACSQSVFASIGFEISQPQISDSNILINASISGLTSSSCFNGMCYLQAAIKQFDGTHYFGETQNNNGDWYAYESQPEVTTIQNTFFRFTPESGSWSGQLSIRFDSYDQYYTGPGSYILRLNRFTGKSSSLAGSSNEIAIQLATATPTPSVTLTPTQTQTPSLTPTNTPTPTKSPTQIPTKTLTPTASPTLTLKTKNENATTSAATVSAQEDTNEDLGLVLGSSVDEPTISATHSASGSAKSTFPWYWLLIFLGGFMAILPLASFVIRYQRRVLRVLK